MAGSARNSPLDAEPIAGFATPAAATVSLAIAIVASALTATGVAQLRLARAELHRTQEEAALDAGQQQVALTLMSARPGSRFGWALATPAGASRALAESEGAKAGLAASVPLDDTTLAKMDVADGTALRARLDALGSGGVAQSLQLASADAAPLWRDCVRSMISPYGAAKTLTLPKVVAPTPGAASGRPGEVWRILLMEPDGWTDERVVRFTGDRYDPWAVVDRRFYRGGQGAFRCEAALGTG